MPEESDDDSVPRDWVRKQLESGDDTKVLKAVLKNRGMNPAIVDDAIDSIKKNPPAKKPEAPLPVPEKMPINTVLRNDVDKILFSAKSDFSISNDLSPIENSISAFADSSEGGGYVGGKMRVMKKTFGNGLRAEERYNKCGGAVSETFGIKKLAAKKARLEHNPIVVQESLFSLFKERVRERFSGIKFGSPKITEYLFDTRIVLLSGFAVAILLIALLASFGLNWYADRVAQSILR